MGGDTTRQRPDGGLLPGRQAAALVNTVTRRGNGVAVHGRISLWARGFVTQRTEALVNCAVLNRVTQLGMPETVRVG
ncbi:MAG TPA: hypothetical protein VGX03_12590 [Candidatus Binatia bacterium]|nr:hypothetical protein [Candidatus Binatia bacterium]